MNVQFKKGVLDLCVLALTAWEDRYGYELAVAMSAKFEVAVGSVYPLLNRLTQEGYFTTYLQESTEGPPRKYYKLTPQGHSHLMSLISEWRSFSIAVDELIKEGVER
ncbi:MULTISPECIES: PadR family transcriptional regulator [unclassified Paenibacillus]|uniref:PadR family transcriptional regulator n=1 Tax=unclassified Paenibacillus TaxID=185978 RepID=UPI000954477F|nr:MULTISPECIES: PadR family transcriptional regulator [unclassified Paenibacillus]ASS68043.1 PadR family transcriptional regulator [Paenibacillus sp. RUD330]SIR40708.1 PadR family transcriptional regulator, regulatory protein PadR [Paenibacillus sp. RU4X]SIR50861.1 PadR family transcriptional regulator, regulatory protein PadR [Paenibacillus sp. RU4T]